MNKPFFSVVIPTKNRPELLRDAISSVLLQNFDDYELIISDNFNDERTKNVINEFRDSPRMHYLRAESELNIPDHWEFATKNTKGVYTLILTDRAFLRQNALKDIHDTIIELKEPPIVFWKYGYFDEEKKILRGEKEEAGAQILKSADLIRNFSRTLDAHFLPRPHVGCYRFDIAEKIRQKIGRLYLPYGPDYTSSLLCLAWSDRVAFIPRPLTLFQGASVSAGTRAQLGALSYLKTLNLTDPFKYVPLKIPLNGSLIFNDLVHIKEIAGGNFRNVDIDWVFYFAFCYQDLVERRLVWGEDKKSQVEFWKEWGGALGTFDKSFRRRVKSELRRRWLNILKSYIRNTSLGNVLLKIKRAFSGRPTNFYGNIFEAGGFKR